MKQCSAKDWTPHWAGPDTTMTVITVIFFRCSFYSPKTSLSEYHYLGIIATDEKITTLNDTLGSSGDNLPLQSGSNAGWGAECTAFGTMMSLVSWVPLKGGHNPVPRALWHKNSCSDWHAPKVFSRTQLKGLSERLSGTWGASTGLISMIEKDHFKICPQGSHTCLKERPARCHFAPSHRNLEDYSQN